MPSFTHDRIWTIRAEQSLQDALTLIRRPRRSAVIL
jgi:hypothetical protein